MQAAFLKHPFDLLLTLASSFVSKTDKTGWNAVRRFPPSRISSTESLKIELQGTHKLSSVLVAKVSFANVLLKCQKWQMYQNLEFLFTF